MKSNNGSDGSNLDPIPDSTGLDLNKLRTFHVIAGAGGVSAAAARLGLTRSAVSHSLAALEEMIGVALFHRVGRRLVLTREGEQLQRAFGAAQTTLDGALSGLAERAQTATGTIHLGLHAGLSRFRLARVTQRFTSEHPGARIRLVHGSREALVERLRAGRIDLALSLRAPEGRSEQTMATRWCEQSLVLAAPSRPRRIDFPTLARLPWIDFFRSEPLVDRWFAHHFPKRRLDPRAARVWAGSPSDLAIELVLAGVGACVLPHDLVEPYRRRNELVVIRGRRDPLRESIWLHELTTEPKSRTHTAFREALLAAT